MGSLTLRHSFQQEVSIGSEAEPGQLDWVMENLGLMSGGIVESEGHKPLSKRRQHTQ